jgi:hypothetical protein
LIGQRLGHYEVQGKLGEGRREDAIPADDEEQLPHQESILGNPSDSERSAPSTPTQDSS